MIVIVESELFHSEIEIQHRLVIDGFIIGQIMYIVYCEVTNVG